MQPKERKENFNPGSGLLGPEDYKAAGGQGVKKERRPQSAQNPSTLSGVGS